MPKTPPPETEASTPNNSAVGSGSAEGNPSLPPVPPTPTTHHRVPFRWQVFADATCAGLAVLVPIPFADLLLQRFFRRRMPAAIAATNNVTIDRERLERLVPKRPLLSAESCLTLPLAAALFVVKRLSRKLLYFLTIKEATDSLSAHWQRAYLIDHIIRAGHLTGFGDPSVTFSALEAALMETSASPLRRIAEIAVQRSHHVLKMLLRARRGGAEAAIRDETGVLERHWNEVLDALAGLAERYEAHRQSQLSEASDLPLAGGAHEAR